MCVCVEALFVTYINSTNDWLSSCMLISCDQLSPAERNHQGTQVIVHSYYYYLFLISRTLQGYVQLQSNTVNNYYCIPSLQHFY